MLNGIKHTQEFMLNEFKTVKQNNTEIDKQNLQVLVVSFVRQEMFVNLKHKCYQTEEGYGVNKFCVQDIFLVSSGKFQSRLEFRGLFSKMRARKNVFYGDWEFW